MTSRARVSIPASTSPARYLRHASKNMSRTCSRVGLNIAPGLAPEFTQVPDQAFRAAGLARQAYVAPVQDQPVVRVLEVLGGGEFQQFLFNSKNVFPRRQSGAIRDAEDV